MELAVTVLEITAPVFILAAIGFTWVKLGFEYRIQFVTRLTMTLAVPALIFTALMKSELDKGALGLFFVAGVLGHLLLALIGWVLVRVMGLNQQTYLAPFIFGNTGNLGIPLALFAFATMGWAMRLLCWRSPPSCLLPWV